MAIFTIPFSVGDSFFYSSFPGRRGVGKRLLRNDALPRLSGAEGGGNVPEEKNELLLQTAGKMIPFPLILSEKKFYGIFPENSFAGLTFFENLL